jgi:DNA mismatch repair protein MutS2
LLPGEHIVNRHALVVLQFPEALDLVSRQASSPLGAEAVRSLHPSDSYAWVTEELRAVDQMLGFLLRSEDWALPAIPDLRLALRRLGMEGSTWEGVALRDAGVLLVSARETRRAISQHAQTFPAIGAIGERLVELPEPERVLRRAIDAAGQVRDEASKELGRLRREIRGARSRIVEKLEQYMASLPERTRVADASVTVREGRYVIPIRRDARGEVGGLVHDESATGNTLFVEPPVAIELMNRLRELEMSEAREVQRILRELTAMLRPHRLELEIALEALVALDSLFARARYALEWNGRRPEILPDASDGLTLVQAKHPLLLAGGEPVVPFDLHMEAAERVLLVSGPNTGGKTVLLKAIGLIGALAQAGIIPPVGDGSRVPMFGDYFADIGDEQSIEASLSTFSAHLKNLREILEAADGESLVLIDEIGSGTDPAEGGALAQAVLIELARRRTMTVATTHLGELKLLAGREPGVVNASLQFDSQELRPTYRLLKGVPGRSYGLAIARRLGFPERLLQDAETFLPEDDLSVNRLLLELEEKEQRMAAALMEAEMSRNEALALRRDVEEREHLVRKREQEAERRARQQARDVLLAAREEVETAIRELRTASQSSDKAAFEEAAKDARRRIEEAAQRQAARTPENEVSRAARTGELTVGSRVRIAATGADGVIVELRDGRATIDTGGLRLQTALSSLEPAPASGKAQKQRAHGGSWSAPDVDASSEIDLRGMRAEEVKMDVERALDAAIGAGLPSLRIIHGKGTGALRQVVTELLKSDRRIRSFRPGGLGEGGTGVTVAELT